MSLINVGKATYKTKKTSLVKQCHKSLIWIDGFNPTRKDDYLIWFGGRFAYCFTNNKKHKKT